MSKINEALSLTKELHKHSIINEDSYYSDKLLQIIINLSTLGEIKLVEGNSQNYQDEISKVKRKVPKWMKKTHQYNYLILKAFMDLSDNNTYRVGVDELEKHVDIGQVFLANYNNLKTISEKNHGKIFDEIDREVELWEHVAEFIEGVFEEYEMKNSDKIKIKIGKFVQVHLENIVELCRENETELKNLQDISYSNEYLGLTSNHKFMDISEYVDHDRYWTNSYDINDTEYRFCSQFGGSITDESGKTRSQREGEIFKKYLTDNDLLLDEYKNKNIKFIVG